MLILKKTSTRSHSIWQLLKPFLIQWQNLISDSFIFLFFNWLILKKIILVDQMIRLIMDQCVYSKLILIQASGIINIIYSWFQVGWILIALVTVWFTAWSSQDQIQFSLFKQYCMCVSSWLDFEDSLFCPIDIYQHNFVFCTQPNPKNVQIIVILQIEFILRTSFLINKKSTNSCTRNLWTSETFVFFWYHF